MTITHSTCLVTGGAGFIGSHLVEELVNLHNRVSVIDIATKPGSWFLLNRLDKKASMHRIDVRNRKDVAKVMKRIKPQHIFHLAAKAIVKEVYDQPADALETNVMGTVNILEAARECTDLTCILVTSSDKAYGKKQGKYRESDALRGDHPYEASKAAADMTSSAYHKTYGLPVVVTRFGNVYGEGDVNFSRIIPGALRSMITGEKLEIRSDGTYIRDYIYVKDIIRGCLGLVANATTTVGDAFNFGSQETLSVLELIAKIEHIMGKRISFVIRNTAKNEIPSQSLDYSKIRRRISWHPQWTLEKTIPQIFDYYKQYHEMQGV